MVEIHKYSVKQWKRPTSHYKKYSYYQQAGRGAVSLICQVRERENTAVAVAR